MKHLRFWSLATLLVFVLSYCKKENDTESSEESATSIIGDWELYQTNSGMSPLTTYPAGNSNIVSFDSTNFKFYRNGQVVYEGTYRLTNDSIVDVNTCALLPPKNDAPNRIIFNNEVIVKNFFEITGNTLKTFSGCIPLDGGYSIYRKRKG